MKRKFEEYNENKLQLDTNIKHIMPNLLLVEEKHLLLTYDENDRHQLTKSELVNEEPVILPLEIWALISTFLNHKNIFNFVSISRDMYRIVDLPKWFKEYEKRQFELANNRLLIFLKDEGLGWLPDYLLENRAILYDSVPLQAICNERWGDPLHIHHIIPSDDPNTRITAKEVNSRFRYMIEQKRPNLPKKDIPHDFCVTVAWLKHPETVNHSLYLISKMKFTFNRCYFDGKTIHCPDIINCLDRIGDSIGIDTDNNLDDMIKQYTLRGFKIRRNHISLN